MVEEKHIEILSILEDTEKDILIEYMRNLAMIAIEHINNKEINEEDYE